MDWDNLELVQEDCPVEYLTKVRRLTEFCLTKDTPVVPRPYHGGAERNYQVLDLVKDACQGLLRHIQQRI